MEKLRRIKESLISSGEFSGEFEKLGGSSEDFGRVRETLRKFRGVWESLRDLLRVF